MVFFFFINTYLARSGVLAGIGWSILLCLVFWVVLGDRFVSQNPKKFYASHFRVQIHISAYIICLYNQILISWTIPRRSLLLPCHVCLCVNFILNWFMWSTVLSLSSHKLYLKFFSVLSTFALMWLVLIAFFSSGIKRCFPFISHGLLVFLPMLAMLWSGESSILL